MRKVTVGWFETPASDLDRAFLFTKKYLIAPLTNLIWMIFKWQCFLVKVGERELRVAWFTIRSLIKQVILQVP